jgi:hypothetical protein
MVKGMLPLRTVRRWLAACVAVAAPVALAHAGELLVNGDFETGTFAGWQTSVQGSNGNLFVQANNGGSTPISLHPYQLNATGGNYFALSDDGGPGSYSLTQSFSVASGTSDVTVGFQLFANDWAGASSCTHPCHDSTESPNQNVEVDILTGGANPFTDNPADIVATLYGPGADPLSASANPWTTYSDDLGALAAGVYQIRFVETDNQNYFNMGVDNVSVDALGVPEPASLTLFGASLILGFAVHRWRRTG